MATPVIRVAPRTTLRRTMPASSMSCGLGRRDLLPQRSIEHIRTDCTSRRVLGLANELQRKREMMRAFKLYTGPDNASHVLEGTIDEKDRTDVIAIHFKETPAHSSYDWHPDPEPQFVITLSGTLEFATPDGETFVVRPGDVLVAEDHIGKGHKWRLIDDQPWRRAYVVLKPGVKDSFVPNTGT